jgi:hypothetical protein
MLRKTVFISSTYQDLAGHRRAVWELLKRFDVNVRGMEAFGARTEGPLDTCLAEVDQCDVYVGIVAFRRGSIDPSTGKSFTQLEYERAAEGGKTMLIYLADEETACFPYVQIDKDSKQRKQLEAFKGSLREQHTVAKFSTPDDLREKLRSDFTRYFNPQTEPEGPTPEEDEFNRTSKTLKEFCLTPKRLNGHEVRLEVSFTSGPYPAPRSLCRQFNLEYGNTIFAMVKITKPTDRNNTDGFTEIYAAGSRVDDLRTLIARKKAELYALLQFSGEDIKGWRAEFFSRTYQADPNNYEQDDDPYTVYVPPEGKVLLLFSKTAS